MLQRNPIYTTNTLLVPKNTNNPLLRRVALTKVTTPAVIRQDNALTNDRLAVSPYTNRLGSGSDGGPSGVSGRGVAKIEKRERRDATPYGGCRGEGGGAQENGGGVLCFLPCVF